MIEGFSHFEVWYLVKMHLYRTVNQTVIVF